MNINRRLDQRVTAAVQVLTAMLICWNTAVAVPGGPGLKTKQRAVSQIAQQSAGKVIPLSDSAKPTVRIDTFEVGINAPHGDHPSSSEVTSPHGDELLKLAERLFDQLELQPEQLDRLWAEQDKLPALASGTLQELAGQRFEVLFSRHLKDAERNGVLVRLEQYLSSPGTARERAELLAEIDLLDDDVALQDMLQMHKQALTQLRESVIRDQKIGVEIVDEGWIIPDELKRGSTYYTPGFPPFKVESIEQTAGGAYRVTVDNRLGATVYELKSNTLVAPERTASWQAAAIEVARSRGVTPELAALWFGLGELYRVTRPDKGDKIDNSIFNSRERQLWAKALDSITMSVAGESSEKFAFRIMHRSYSGPVGAEGALTSNDLYDLTVVLVAAADQGLDLVRLGVAGQRALFTQKMGWEQVANQSSDPGNFFGEDFNLQKPVPAHVDSVIRAALWNYGIKILSDGKDLRHLKSIEKVKSVDSLSFGTYVPRKVRKESDSFSSTIDALKESPSLEAARAIVQKHETHIRDWLSKAGVEVSDSLVVIPAPSSTDAAHFLAQSITEMFSSEGVQTREVFEKRVLFWKAGENSKTELVARSVKGAINLYDRVSLAYIGTGIKQSAGISEGKNLLIVDDITTMGCTRDVCGILAGLFNPEKIMFLSAGETK